MRVQRLTLQLSRVVLGIAGLAICISAGCKQCERAIERAAVEATSVVGSTSTAGGTVVAFLRERQDGHSGELYWREAVKPYPRMDSNMPINPSDWALVLVKDGKNSSRWTWLRYRVKSTAANGNPIEKLWDFCLNETVDGYRIVRVVHAEDSTVEACSESPTWAKYQYQPRPAGR